MQKKSFPIIIIKGEPYYAINTWEMSEIAVRIDEGTECQENMIIKDTIITNQEKIIMKKNDEIIAIDSLYLLSKQTLNAEKEARKTGEEIVKEQNKTIKKIETVVGILGFVAVFELLLLITK